MPTIVGILIFMSRINSVLSIKSFITSGSVLSAEKNHLIEIILLSTRNISLVEKKKELRE